MGRTCVGMRVPPLRNPRGCGAGQPSVLAMQGSYQEGPDLDYEVLNTIQPCSGLAVQPLTSFHRQYF